MTSVIAVPDGGAQARPRGGKQDADDNHGEDERVLDERLAVSFFGPMRARACRPEVETIEHESTSWLLPGRQIAPAVAVASEPRRSSREIPMGWVRTTRSVGSCGGRAGTRGRPLHEPSTIEARRYGSAMTPSCRGVSFAAPTHCRGDERNPHPCKQRWETAARVESVAQTSSRATRPPDCYLDRRIGGSACRAVASARPGRSEGASIRAIAEAVGLSRPRMHELLNDTTEPLQAVESIQGGPTCG